MKPKVIGKVRYWGAIVREICPSLYGKPVYDRKGDFINYTIVIPKVGNITDLGD